MRDAAPAFLPPAAGAAFFLQIAASPSHRRVARASRDPFVSDVQIGTIFARLARPFSIIKGFNQ
jgi:hypothetical protein